MNAVISSAAFRYALVGAVNTVFYGCLLYIFLELLPLPRFIAVALSFALAMIFQYSANRIFTFRSSNYVRNEVPRYITVALINYILTVGIVMIAVDHFKLSSEWVSVLAAAITAVTGYVLSLSWVFKK